MPHDTKMIDEKALDSLSIAPGSPEENAQIHHPRQNAGQDESIAKRLERDPTSPDAVAAASLIDCSNLRRRSGCRCGSAAAAQKAAGSHGRISAPTRRSYRKR